MDAWKRVLPRESTIAASIITIATMPNTSSSYQPRNGNAIRHAMLRRYRPAQGET